MSSELMKKLEDREQTLRENLFYKSAEEYDQGYIRGFFEALGIAEKHEAQQMKEPFYQLTDEQEQSLQECKDTYLYFKSIGRKWDQDLKVEHAFTEWAIEQEKLKEEK